MNYKKIYDSIVSNAQGINKRAYTSLGIYVEKHHIIPRSMGGSDDGDNLVYLTSREHFLAHWLLYRIYKSKEMALAFHAMSFDRDGNRYSNSRAIGESRRVMGEANADFLRAKADNRKGKKNPWVSAVVTARNKSSANIYITSLGAFKGRTEVSKAHGVSFSTIAKWVRDGEAISLCGKSSH